jgi:quercetin dioxygenase-like cupin family protein
MVDDGVTQQRQAVGVVREAGAGRVVSLGEAGAVTLKLVGAESAGALAAYEFVTPPATAGPPLHLHRAWDEAFYVLEGEMTFLIAGQTHLAGAGAFVFIPRGVEHTFWNASTAPARQLTIFTPAGIEDYFDAVSRVLDGDGADSLQAAIALMEQHDMVVPATTQPAYGALGASDQPSGSRGMPG